MRMLVCGRNGRKETSQPNEREENKNDGQMRIEINWTSEKRGPKPENGSAKHEKLNHSIIII